MKRNAHEAHPIFEIAVSNNRRILEHATVSKTWVNRCSFLAFNISKKRQDELCPSYELTH
jgi:hypothetical protein